MAKYRENLIQLSKNAKIIIDYGKKNNIDPITIQQRLHQEITRFKYTPEQFNRARTLLIASKDKDAEFGIFKPALHGLTAGGSDEIIAGARAAFDWLTSLGDEDYEKSFDEYLAAERLSLAEYERLNPKKSFTSEVAGAFAPMLMPMKPGALTPKFSKGLREGTRFKQGVPGVGGKAITPPLGWAANPLVGATWGALSSYLTAEDDRTENISEGAALGATLGTALPVAGKLTGAVWEIIGGPAVWEKILTSLGHGDEWRRWLSDKKFLEILEKSGGISKAEKKLKEAELAGVDEMGIPDTSYTATRTARGLAAKPGAADEIAQEAVENRTAGQEGRVAGHLMEGISEGDEEMSKLLRKEPYLAKDDLIQDRKTRAEEWYNAAYEEPNFDSEELEILFDTIPELRKAYATARENANTQAASLLARMFSGSADAQTQRAAQDAFDQAFLPEKPEFTINALHQTQLSLKSAIDSLFQNPETVPRAKILKQIRARLLEVMEENSDNYATARSLYKGDSDMKDAFDEGAKFFNKTASEIRADITGFDGRPPIYNDILEQRMYRKAAADALLLRMNRSADSADLTKKVYSRRDNSELSQKLRAIFPSEEAYLEYINRMRIEQRMAFTDQKIRGVVTQSQTTPLEKESDFIDESFPNMMEIMKSPVSSAGRIVGNVAPNLSDRSRFLREGVRDEMAPTMFDFNTKRSLQELQRLREFQNSLSKKRDISNANQMMRLNPFYRLVPEINQSYPIIPSLLNPPDNNTKQQR